MGIALEGLERNCLDDADTLFHALDRFCEPSGDLALMQAIVLIKRVAWHDAIRMLDEINDGNGPLRLRVHVKSFKAYAQMKINDPSWHHTAEEVWESGGSVDELMLVGTLLRKSSQEIELQAQSTTAAGAQA